DEGVPVVLSAIALGIERDHPRGRRVVRVVEEQELEPRGIGRVDAEVDAVGRQGGPERVWPTGLGNRAVVSHTGTLMGRSIEHVQPRRPLDGNVPPAVRARPGSRNSTSWSTASRPTCSAPQYPCSPPPAATFPANDRNRCTKYPTASAIAALHHTKPMR